MTPLASALDPEDVPDRLRTVLDLDVDVLSRATRHGFDHASMCTPNDVATLPGLLMWAKTTSGLADEAAPDGWTRRRLEGLECVVCPDLRRAIIVTAGNEHTGRLDGQPPRARYPRGAAVRGGVDRNTQRSLFAELEPDPIPSASIAAYEMWWLLHFWDRARREVRSEISYPVHVDDDTVTGWRERLILPTVRLGSEPDVDVPADDDIDFPLPERR